MKRTFLGKGAITIIENFSIKVSFLPRAHSNKKHEKFITKISPSLNYLLHQKG